MTDYIKDLHKATVTGPTNVGKKSSFFRTDKEEYNKHFD